MTVRRPGFAAADAVRLAGELYGVQVTTAAELPSYQDRNFHLAPPSGGAFVLKFFSGDEDPAALAAQQAALDALAAAADADALPCRVPRVVPTRAGEPLGRATDSEGRVHAVRLVAYLPGEPMAAMPRPWPKDLRRHLGGCLAAVDRVLAGARLPGEDRTFDWDLRQGRRVAADGLRLVEEAGRRAILSRFLDLYDARVAPLEPRLRTGLIHGDANDHNVLVQDGRVTGLLDFGDATASWLVAEPAIAAAYAAMEEDDPVEAAAAVVAGYHAVHPLEPAELAAFFPLVALRLCVSVTMSARQRAERASGSDRDEAYLFVSEAPAWKLLERLAAVHPDTAHEAVLEATGATASGSVPGVAGRAPAPASPSAGGGDSLLDRRRALLGPNLSLSYRSPLHITRGWMQYLYDAAGRAYLDAVNNIAHVGHSHPRVVAAMARQAAALNTNTRYLHENVLRLAERLTATLPEPLRVCYFVNSGSEANELALRLARAYTGRRGVIAAEGGYHGNTTSLVEISPYKFDGPGGSGAPEHVRAVPTPHTFRWRYRDDVVAASGPGDAGPAASTGGAAGRGEDVGPGARYAAHVAEAARDLAAAGHGVACFFFEPIMSCAGQVPAPPAFLPEAYEHVRAAGGICVADEVQTGFGRVGTHFWAFQEHGVVPDIVTMGKPMGNGHPVAAVVTAPAIAAAFHNGMEYFNSFGGNPVSAAAALAVLDVIRDEGLQERAAHVGERLAEALAALKDRHPAVGDVRGRGLFLGVELVRDPETREAAGELAAGIVARLREAGILTSTDGPDRNVLKIKPPLAFGEADADRLADALDRALDVR